MVKHQTFTNETICNLAVNLIQYFQNMNFTLPVRVNFYLQKNMSDIIVAAQEIDKEREQILARYGKINEETQQYEFEDDVIETVNTELRDLFNITQEIKINMIPLSSFDEIELDSNQVSAISFMIQDEEE